jgi:hypothetical protein
MLIFGGEDAGGGALGDLWSLDLATFTWRRIIPSGSSPPPRILASATYDEVNQRMVLFGGRYAETNYFNDVYFLQLSPGHEAWSQPALIGDPPSGRYGHKAVLNKTTGQMYITGGHNGTIYFSDTWAFSACSLPTVATDNATGIAGTAATLNGTIISSGGEPCQYRFCYGILPGVYTDNTTWSSDNRTTGMSFSNNIIGLSPSMKYYFIAECKNSTGAGSGLERTFTTTASAPTITNASGATSIMATTAILNGNLTYTGGLDTTILIYGGTEDGGTPPGSWDHNTSLGIRPEGAFSLGITGIPAGSTYYYRCYAINSAGASWAPSSASFTTQSSLGLWRNYWEGPGKDWLWFSSGGP